MLLRFALLACLALSTPLRSEPLTVFAAASLKEPLDQFAAAHGEVTVAYAGSGTIARQILQGAPADVVVLANSDWMDVLEASEAIVPDSRVGLLGNRLVLVSADPGDVALTTQGLAHALSDGRLAIGFVDAVPAGIYGQAALRSLGLWDVVHDRLAEVDSVRAALALVARREAPLGLVYATDVTVEPDVFEVARLPATSHPPIRYEAALVSLAGRAFLDALQSDAARAQWRSAGFLPPPPAPDPAQ